MKKMIVIVLSLCPLSVFSAPKVLTCEVQQELNDGRIRANVVQIVLDTKDFSKSAAFSDVILLSSTMNGEVFESTPAIQIPYGIDYMMPLTVTPTKISVEYVSFIASKEFKRRLVIRRSDLSTTDGQCKIADYKVTNIL
jgi:hypothetical protein